MPQCGHIVLTAPVYNADILRVAADGAAGCVHGYISTTDYNDVLSGRFVGFWYPDFICPDLVNCVFFQAADVNGIVAQIPSAAFLTWMLTDHGAGSRQRIVPADYIDGTGIIFVPYQSNVSRNIDMDRTKIHAGNFLTSSLRALVPADVTFILIFECIQSIQNFRCGLVTNRAVRGIADHGGQRCFWNQQEKSYSCYSIPSFSWLGFSNLLS